MNTDFIILCGGQGTRLRSVVGESQKVMAKIGDQPFLDLIIGFILKQGGRRIILSTGFKAKDVEAYYSDRFRDAELVFSREDEPLGTGGAIKKACALIGSDHFFVLNGDSLCPLNMKAMLAQHVSREALATVAISKVDDVHDFGSIGLQDNESIASFQEKLAASGQGYVNAGVYCFRRGIERFMPLVSKFSLERDFFPTLIGRDFYGFVTPEPFIDIGTPERLAWALKHL